VEQHQRWGKPEEADVPEFTIEVTYRATSALGTLEGYRYVLKWLWNGQQCQARSYGFGTRDEAVAAAKYKARQKALELSPVHVETYRPEL
jgi:hypothetical protein